MRDEVVKKLKSRLFLSRTGDFDNDCYGYITTTDTEIRRLQSLIRERKFSSGDTDVSSRVIGHWQEKGLLPKRTEDEGWRKFSFVELVWVLVLQHTRPFNVSLERLKIAKDNVLIWNKEQNTYPIFEYYLVKALMSDADSYVVITQDSRADIGFATDIQEHLSDVTGSDMVIISLKNICEEFGLHPKRYRPLHYLSEAEVEMLHAVRLGGHKEVDIVARNDKPVYVAPTSVVTDEISSLVRKIKEDGSFGDIISSFENGKKQSVKVRKKRKISP